MRGTSGRYREEILIHATSLFAEKGFPRTVKDALLIWIRAGIE